MVKMYSFQYNTRTLQTDRHRMKAQAALRTASRDKREGVRTVMLMNINWHE